MFKNFFIFIGGLTLSFINFFNTSSFENIKFKKDKSTEFTPLIFSKLNLELEKSAMAKKDTNIDKIRDVLIKYLLNKYIVLIFISIGVLLILLTRLELFGIYLVFIAMSYIFVLYYPQMENQRSYSDLNQELPYALRHMGIELKSGKGLHDALITIKNSNYGSLSKEFNRVLEEVKFGKPIEKSLVEMTQRVNSNGLSRAIHQIIGTLRVGGNLANSLEIIAQDISFEMQIRLKEYSQKLNSFILIYTFIAILAPVVSLIMLMAGSTVMGDVVSSELLFMIYTIFFPMVVVLMGFFIKKLEPRI